MKEVSQKIENSIIKKYRKEIWHNFVKAIQEFDLIEDGDKIAVCISGGKDSFLLAKCMEELQKHGKINFDLCYILMNPGYSEKHLDLIHQNASKLNLNLHIFNSNIFEQIEDEKDICYLCARKRRGALYSEAKRLGCNKIALGHHFDDVVETILLSMIYNGEFKTMMPILSSVNFKPIKLIRPLYYVREKDIISWVNYNNLSFIDCACKVTEKKLGKRSEVKKLIQNLNKLYKGADINIMNSTKNVNLNTIISYLDKKE